MPITGKLGEATLDDRAPVSWTITDGVQPSIGSFTMDRAQAAKLTNGSTVNLSVTNGPYTLNVKGLWVIGRGGTIDPFSETVVVSDSRLKWRRKWVRRTFNMRRRSGQRRRQDADGALPAEVAPVLDDATYAAQTTKNPGASILTPFSSAEIAEIVFDEVMGEDGWTGVLDQFPNAVVDNVEIDARGDNAVADALATLPGAAIYYGRDGIAHVKNALDLDAATQQLKTAGDEFVGGGHPVPVTLTSQRPHEIGVLFDVEQEVRFDHNAEASSTEYGLEVRFMENVIQVPDPTITMVSGKYKDTKVVAGTWVRMSDYFRAINADKGGANVPDITEERVREFFLMPEFWMAKYIPYSQVTADVIWSARIGAIQEHWRSSFRINRRWMNRIYSMRNVRVSIVDIETGNFGVSPAYMHWSVRASMKGIQSRAFANQGMTFDSGAGVSAGTSLASAKPAPAVVSIPDPELGILKLTLRNDLLGNRGITAPGQLANHASLQANQGSRPVTTDGSAYGRTGLRFSLSATFKASVIVSVAPMSPNNIGRLHRVPVDLKKAKEFLPKSIQGALPGATGPKWDMRIGAGLMTARFAWVHNNAAKIEREFGVGSAFKSVVPRTNEDLMNWPEMLDLSQVTAAGLYASMPDHWEGSIAVAMNESLLPLGNITAVIHTLTQDGEAITQLALPDSVIPFDGMAALPRSTRNLILRQVQNPVGNS